MGKQLNDVMIWAADIGNLEILKKAVEQGANIHAKDDEALRNAAFYGHLEMVKYLVEHGADVHAENGWALRRASYYGHIPSEIVKLLTKTQN